MFILIDTTKAGSCEPTIKASGPSTEYHVDLDKILDKIGASGKHGKRERERERKRKRKFGKDRQI